MSPASQTMPNRWHPTGQCIKKYSARPMSMSVLPSLFLYSTIKYELQDFLFPSNPFVLSLIPFTLALVNVVMDLCGPLVIKFSKEYKYFCLSFAAQCRDSHKEVSQSLSDFGFERAPKNSSHNYRYLDIEIH